jgi:hypothetical protein
MIVLTVDQVLASSPKTLDTWEDECKYIRDWCNDHNAYYYARPKEDFNEHEARVEARDLGVEFLILEDLS